MSDGYGAYRRQLSEDLAAREDDLAVEVREGIRYADELESENPGLWLGAGRIARELALHSLRRRSADPRERAMQAEYDRQALALERRIIFGGGA